MLISVIIPIYNCASYLRECLDSVLSQSYKDWECICVDDGSTDESGDICDEYALLDARFKVIHKPNGGEGSARNAGLEVFKGEFVYFVDSDDVINSRTLEVCYSAFKEYPEADLVSLDMVTFEENGQPNYGIVISPRSQCLNISKEIHYKVFGITVWNTAYKAQMIKNKRFTDLIIGADRVFVFDVLEEAKTIVVNNFIGYGYRIRQSSISNIPMSDRKFLSDLKHRMYFISKLIESNKRYDWFIVNRFAKDYTEYMSSCYFRMTKEHRKKCLSEWCDAMRIALNYKGWSLWRQFVLQLCSKTKSQFTIRMLCYLPYWLKTHGVNRRFIVNKK